MKIVYFGGGKREKVLLRILESNEFTVTHIILAENEAYKKTYFDISKANSINLIPVNKKNMVRNLKGISADIFLSVGFRYLLPKEIFTRPKYAVNVHPTLLPKYRGAFSGNYIIINREKESGVTVHFINEGIDAGDIILQKSFPLSVFDTAESLSRKTYEFEPSIVMECLIQLKNGTYKVTKQPVVKEIKYKIRTPRDSRIDPNKSIIEQYNLIRACHPEKYPAFFYLENEKIILKLARVNKPKKEQDMI